MKNKLVDLNNHLFAELERLSDEELKGDALTEEIVRSKAVSDIAGKIIANANVVLQAQKFVDNKVSAETKLPPMLEE